MPHKKNNRGELENKKINAIVLLTAISTHEKYCKIIV
jgi:hypothetical protein